MKLNHTHTNTNADTHSIASFGRLPQKEEYKPEAHDSLRSPHAVNRCDVYKLCD